MKYTTHDKPLASKGLKSYRAKGPYGYIMIGAKDHDDALKEAKRSNSSITKEDLEIWDGKKYIPVYSTAKTVVDKGGRKGLAKSGEGKRVIDKGGRKGLSVWK